MNIFSFIIAIVIGNLVIDIFYRKFWHFELHRKISHISGGVAIATMIWLFDWKTVLFAGIFLSMGVFLVRKYHLSAILEEAWKQRRWYGELYFAMGMFFVLWVSVYEKNIAIVAILITTLADGLAPFWRSIWNKPLYRNKTFGGSIVFFVVASSIIYFWFTLPIYEVLFISLCATLTELLAPDGADNLLIPFVTSVLLFGTQFV